MTHRDRRAHGGPARRALAILLILVTAVTACGGDDSGAGDDAGGDPPTTAPPTTAPPTTPSTRPADPDTPTDATQPPQPRTGPGGADYAHDDWRVSEGGEGADAWYVFEPAGPRPRTAPLAIVLHGYFEYAGYDQMYELIRHTVRTGSVVVYPRYQTDVAEPCPGPVDIEPCMDAAVAGIRGALDFLGSDPSRVQPELDEADWFGFSFGGILTTNLANRHEELGLPAPRVLFLDDPHDGGLAGLDEPALDDPLAGVPESTLVVCHAGAEGVIAGPGAAGASCNSLFPRLDHVPAENKALVSVGPDRHGTPPLGSGHGVCVAEEGAADGYDWGFCWRTWDALRSAAGDGTDRRYALGDTPEQRSLGAWSDGVAVRPLQVRDRPPISW